MRNLTQSTYDRIKRHLRDMGDRYPHALNSTDAKELLEAYEGAHDLLEQLISTNHDLGGSDFIADVCRFLKTDTGRLRVTLDDGEPLSYSEDY